MYRESHWEEDLLFKRILVNGAKTGAALTAVTTAHLLAASANETDGAWGAINNISHIVDGDDVEYSNDFSTRDSSVGLAINGTAMFIWGWLYELVFGRVEFPQSIATATVFTAGAYAVDYYIVPKQYTPGIEHKISKNAIITAYVLMGLVLALAPFWTRRR
jgi:hypothetical protein